MEHCRKSIAYSFRFVVYFLQANPWMSTAVLGWKKMITRLSWHAIKLNQTWQYQVSILTNCKWDWTLTLRGMSPRHLWSGRVEKIVTRVAKGCNSTLPHSVRVNSPWKWPYANLGQIQLNFVSKKGFVPWHWAFFLKQRAFRPFSSNSLGHLTKVAPYNRRLLELKEPSSTLFVKVFHFLFLQNFHRKTLHDSAS